jgi:hypothetical protein
LGRHPQYDDGGPTEIAGFDGFWQRELIFAPILMSFSFRVVSDQSLIGSGVGRGRTEIVSECVKLKTNRVGGERPT